MDIVQEDRVFLVRNDEVLIFKQDDTYDGDNVNVDDYTKPEFLRYVAAKRIDDSIKQVFYYFAKISDQYLTQSGKWIDLNDTSKYPTRPLTAAVLNNFLAEGQYDNEIRFGTKNGDEVVFEIVTE